MKRLIPALAIAVAAALWLPVAAQASFGFNDLKVTITADKAGTPATQAGLHPFAFTTSFGLNYEEDADGNFFTEGRFKDVFLKFIAGLAGDITAYEPCTLADFSAAPTACRDESALGVTANSFTTPFGWYGSPVYSIVPPPGVALRLGFHVVGVAALVDVGIKRDVPYAPTAGVHLVSEVLRVFGDKTQLWGNPSHPDHNDLRGKCYFQEETLAPGEELEFESEESKTCSIAPRPRPLLTLPTRCEGQNLTSFAVTSWEHPGTYQADGEPNLADPNWVTGSFESPPFTECQALHLNASITAQPTTRAAQSPSGLDVGLDVHDEGLTSTDVLAGSDIRKTVVTLPKGVTINPSQAEGLEVCSEADLDRETLAAEPGEGCPEASKIGTVEVESPLIEGQVLKGDLFVAEPYENPFGSLIAVYAVFKNRELGIVVKQPIKVEPDPVTGQLVGTADDIPQLPFSHFRLHFREGARSPLVSPPGCGSFDTVALLYPWSGGDPLPSTSTFEIISGPNNSPCPSGAAPFHPGFEAGTNNNVAGRYSPFYMRVTRNDGEQDMGKFSFVLPPGLVPKLAGIPYCSEAAIAQAKSRTGAHGGQEELDNPSCPAASKIGRTLAGAGVGSQLTYVPGSLYLAGPYHGDPLSAVAITPAVAGPFDAGTVVVREALRLNPVTHVGEVDGAASDPIPHILKGIPLNLRDLRVYADRPEFTLNATSCEPSQALATIWGDGTALLPLGETPASVGSRYQAADCQALGFKPKLGLQLRGGTKRGRFPALHAVYTPRPGQRDANLKRIALLFPSSEFIEQGHFRTICTRVQFAAGAGNGAECPAGSIYGHVRAWSPLLDEPLSGPVYLRSSNHDLPDAVFALHGLVDIDVAVRIDSAHGGLRATLEDAPDAPVSRAIVDMQGGQKGLFVNSTDLCSGKHHATSNATGQNGKLSRTKPVVRAVKCGKAQRKKHRGHRRAG